MRKNGTTHIFRNVAIAAAMTVAGIAVCSATAPAAAHTRPDTVKGAPPVETGAEDVSLSIKSTPKFVAAKLSVGQVLSTNDFVSGKYAIPLYNSVTVKFGSTSAGDRWQDIAYGMPYYGLGLCLVDFRRGNDLGSPVSLFILQGATMTHIYPWLALNYEWNLGVSMGWKPYDPFVNRDNVAIGSDLNIHVGLSLYLKWFLNPRLDLHIGAGLTHFSNGAIRMPNSGINMYSVFLEGFYNFNGPRIQERYGTNIMAPEFKRHYYSDISATISSRRISIDTTGTNMPGKYLDHKFNVLGLNYSLMRANGYRYRYGADINLSYDESTGSRAMRRKNDLDGNWYDIIYYGNVGKRFSLGVSAKGEIALPGYSVFANLGLQLFDWNRNAKGPFYQVIGVKIYLKENFFGTFGVRASHFSAAQYLFWSLGYTIKYTKGG